MTEFKTVVEEFKSERKKMTEFMLHLDEKMVSGFQKMDAGFHRVTTDIASLKQQVALLHEGQTEIKSELRRKADYEDFAKLEKRVARLERKTA
jgi:hypothetical protein